MGGTMKKRNKKSDKFLRILVVLLTFLFMLGTLFGCMDFLDEIFDYEYHDEGLQEDPSYGHDTGYEHQDAEALVSPPQPRTLTFEPIEPGFTTDDPNIRIIEVNQSLSYGFDSNTGEFFLMENFVGGKETAIFVNFEQPFDQNSTAVLTIERCGEFVAELLPVDMPDSHTLLFQPRNLADVEHWEVGAYTFTFEMGGSTAVRTTNFHQSMPLTILAVPIIANYSGRIVRCEGEWRESSTMIYATFPVARADVEFILGAELDLSDSKYDLDTDDGCYYVWEALTNLQTKNNDYTLIVGFVRDIVLNGTVLGYTYGMPTSIVVENEPDMIATVVHEIAHCYNIGDEYEGGHLSLGINAAPYRMEGIDIFNNRRVVADRQAVVGGDTVGLEGTGSVIYEAQRPYWVEGRQLLGYVTSYMGSGTGANWDSLWTTSDKWDHLFNIFTGVTPMPMGGFAGGGAEHHDDFGILDIIDILDFLFFGRHVDGFWGNCPDCFSDIRDPLLFVECRDCPEFIEVTENEFQCDGCQSRWTLEDYDDDSLFIECATCHCLVSHSWLKDFNSGQDMAAREAQLVLVTEITGFIEPDGSFVSSPWYTFESDPSLVTMSRSGDYSVHIYDSAGGLLSTTFFNVAPFAKMRTVDGPTFVEGLRMPVDVTVRHPGNAARFDIQRGDQVIYTKNVSNNAPTVAFTGLTDYQELSDIVTLTWDAYDADGDELFFEIWYSPYDEEFYNIAANITGRSITLDLSEYPGSDEAYFYIYATDGVLTAEIYSPWVKVPFKAPQIFSELDGIPEYKITGEILFDAEIYDLQDGWLWDVNEVVWTLDGREFMSGSFLWVWPYELPPGTHTFVCTATNSAGLSTQKEFTFRIVDDESDLPDDWSREDIVNALIHGFVTPLDRIDAPITRGQFATLMATLYGWVSEEYDPFPDYEEGVVTDSGWDNYDQFLMVFLGVMEAPGGRFQPNRPLTEQEAAVIMYKVVALADPDLLDANEGERFILELFDEVEVFDDSGPNAYSATRNLTNRLALVRVSRMFEAIFE